MAGHTLSAIDAASRSSRQLNPSASQSFISLLAFALRAIEVILSSSLRRPEPAKALDSFRTLRSNVTKSGDVMICDDRDAPREGVGMKIVGPVSTRLEELLRPSAGQNDYAIDRALAIFVAELFAILHPATLPMLEHMFADVKQDAENDGELELKWRAEFGLAAARIALREQEALDT
jgi:hypothetical protein